MVFTPTFAIVTPEAIPDNVLAYIANETRQKEALGLAGGSNLKLLKNLLTTAAARIANPDDPKKPIYPSIAFDQDNDAADYTGDLTNAGYSMTLECSVQNKDPNHALAEAKIYRRAVKMLIRNIPDAVLLVNTGCTSVVLQTMEGGLDAVQEHRDRKNDFLQTFQVRTTYTLIAQNYS